MVKKIEKIPDRSFIRGSEEMLDGLEIKTLIDLPLVAMTEKNKKQFYVLEANQFKDVFIIRDEMRRFENLVKSILEAFKKKAEEGFNINLENPVFIFKDWFMIVSGVITEDKPIKEKYKEVEVLGKKTIMKLSEYSNALTVSTPICSLFEVFYNIIYENYVDVSDLI